MINLLVALAFTQHREPELLGKRVDDQDTDAMEHGGYLVAVVVELSAGVHRRQDDLRGRHALLFMNVDRNASSVVADRDRLTRMDRDYDTVAVASERFVDG